MSKPKGSKRTMAAKRESIVEKRLVSIFGDLADGTELGLMRAMLNLGRLNLGLATSDIPPEQLTRITNAAQGAAGLSMMFAVVQGDASFFEKCAEAVRFLKRERKADPAADMVLAAIHRLLAKKKRGKKISAGDVLDEIAADGDRAEIDRIDGWEPKDLRDVARSLGLRFPLDVSALRDAALVFPDPNGFLA